jgi:mono/diheme cytochrome c family protein
LNTHRQIRTTAATAALLAVIGCATIEELAPPVGALTLREGETMGVNAENLERGRTIYITQCARCHSPEPVTGYTESQWRETLPRMSHEAMLTDRETADVRDYVMATVAASAAASTGDGARGP